MMELIARPLAAETFLPFAEVVEAPVEPGQRSFNSALGNLRSGANPNLRIINILATTLPLKANLLERHEFSSQTFLPLEVSRVLIVVAPQGPEGGPDVERAQAFLASSWQGFTYRPNTWHHGLTALDQSARLAVFMWCDGTAADEQFVSVPAFFVREP
jgi:ureidoglycolate lyase